MEDGVFISLKKDDEEKAGSGLADDERWCFFSLCLGASICCHVNEV